MRGIATFLNDCEHSQRHRTSQSGRSSRSVNRVVDPPIRRSLVSELEKKFKSFI